MSNRPSVKESLQFLNKYTEYDSSIASAVEEYHRLKASGQEFLASRMIVEIVHTYNEDNIDNGKKTSAS